MITKKKLIYDTVVIFIFFITIQNAISLSCSCASYPCSTATCSGDYCSSNVYYEYTGTCEATGFGGGICEEDDDPCGSDVCIEGYGCGECVSNSDCNSDYYYCSGNDIYEKDYYCSLIFYACFSTSDFIEDCDDYDGYSCSGQSAYYNNYGCSGGSCVNTPSLLADCSSYTTAWSSWECITSSKSYRDRDVGVCDLFELTYCDTVLDYEDENCAYGCANLFNEKEYQYECSNYEDYSLYYRDIEGYCRQESDLSWTITGTGLICTGNTWCENDELITSSSTPYNPCETFNPSTNTNQTYISLGTSFSIKTTSYQTFNPDVVLYDYTNDGVYDIGHGSGCDSAIQNTYCGGASCCSGENYNYDTIITPGSLGSYTIKSLSLETSESFSETNTFNYIVKDGFVVPVIASGNLLINKDNDTALISTSYGDPSVTSLCWRDGVNKFECYGDINDCLDTCPAYTYINSNINTNFDIEVSITGNRKIQLLATNGIQTDTDKIQVCVYDYLNGKYCGTCDDGIQNDDETGVDFGGHCGTCFDGIKNGFETYKDYGGNCGTCFDGKRQDFELIDIDYGGICGNCTGVKESDTYWAFGHDLSKDVPFDYGYCGESTEAVLGLITSLSALVIIGLVILIIVVLVSLFVSISSFISGITGFFVIVRDKLSSKDENKKSLNNKKV